MNYYYSSSRNNNINTTSASSSSNRNQAHENTSNAASSSPNRHEQKVGDKDLYSSSSDDDDNDKIYNSLSYIKNEGYESFQKRREAAVILDNPELLLMYSNARNDSLAGTRYHFTKIFCGLSDEEEEVEESKKIQKL